MEFDGGSREMEEKTLLCEIVSSSEMWFAHGGIWPDRQIRQIKLLGITNGNWWNEKPSLVSYG